MRSNAKNLMMLILLPFMIVACQINPAQYTLERSTETPSLKHSAWTTYSYNGYVNDMAFDADGDLWTTSPSGGVTRWDLTAKTYTQYTPEHGLANNDMYVISVAPDGDVWAGSQTAGLSYFDGETWTTYTTTGELPIRRILSISAGPNHTVWASGDGIYHFDGNAWTTYEQDAWVEAIEFAADGTVWSNLHFGLARFDGNTWQAYDGAPKYVRDIALAKDGTVWVITPSEIGQFDGHSWQIYSADNAKVPAEPYKIIISPDGIVWVGGNNGVARFDGTSWQFYSTMAVEFIAIRDDDALWISNRREPGIFRFDGKLHENFTLVDAPFYNTPINPLRTMVAGNNDEIWVSFDNDVGVYRHDNGQQGNEAWTPYVEQIGLTGIVRSIAVSSNQTMWFATDNKIMSFDGQHWKKERSQRSTIEHLAIMENDDVWIVDGYGISSFDGLKWQSVPTPFAVINNNISAVATTADLGLFVGTTDGYIYYYDQTDWVKVHKAYSPELGSISIDAITVEGNHVWVATFGLGIFKFDITPKTEYWPYELYQIDDGLPSNSVTSIVVSPVDNTIWAGTAFGITTFDGNKWQVYTADDGLASNRVSNITVLSDGTVWVGTTRGGISRFIPPTHN